MNNTNNLPEIISEQIRIKETFPMLSEKEHTYINEARALFQQRFYSYCLLAIWNAATSNLKRKVEAYGIEIWSSTVKNKQGRKTYDINGSTIAERWSDVDDIILISGAKDIGLIDSKAAKSLEMINWMRNHTSSAHDSDNRVEEKDVIALVLLLEENLFKQPLPEPKHSISAVFKPIKSRVLNSEELITLDDQIKSYNNQEIKTLFGFLLDLLTTGNEQIKTNVFNLFPAVWEKANDDLRKTLGIKYHEYMINSNENEDENENKDVKTSIFELLIKVDGVSYIPEGTRAKIYRKASTKLAEAKNTMYGWSKEESASKFLRQLGIKVPSVVFEIVYQEILSIWCGNYWGKSESQPILKPFIDSVSTEQIKQILKMFKENNRVKEELYQQNPKNEAIKLLHSFENRLTLELHKEELRDVIEFVKNL
jgi:hypothetical protein